MEENGDTHDEAFDNATRDVISLGNHLAEQSEDEYVWDIADGLLAGAIQYWLYTRLPCDEPWCEDCENLNTSEKRLKELLRFSEELARESDYFHCPNDKDAGRA